MQAYLDNSATTQPCEAAIAAMTDCMRGGWQNPSSVYAPAVAVFRHVREARENLLRPIHGAGCELIFTSGGTEAN
ncbi:MAG: aminotransferase class V-fold PLP-dependent enzyme, partial [bacterium]